MKALLLLIGLILSVSLYSQSGICDYETTTFEGSPLKTFLAGTILIEDDYEISVYLMEYKGEIGLKIATEFKQNAYEIQNKTVFTLENGKKIELIPSNNLNYKYRDEIPLNLAYFIISRANQIELKKSRLKSLYIDYRNYKKINSKIVFNTNILSEQTSCLTNDYSNLITPNSLSFNTLNKLTTCENFPYNSYKIIEDLGFDLLGCESMATNVGFSEEDAKLVKIDGTYITSYDNFKTTIKIQYSTNGNKLTYLDNEDDRIIEVLMMDDNIITFNKIVRSIKINCTFIGKEYIDGFYTFKYKNIEDGIFYQFKTIKQNNQNLYSIVVSK